MLIIPAVDIKSGKAVRLKQGKADQETVYDADPLHAARHWASEGAKRIHVVDLDGAFEGTPRNRSITLAIINALKVEIEVGGGLRTARIAEEFLDAGAARCVIGTKALEDRDFLKNLASRHPGQISAGLDAKRGMLLTKGWVESSGVLALDLIASLYDLPLGEVIYTDVERDGMLQGPNFTRLEEMRRACPFPLIASGGITTMEHVRLCKALGCFGAIIGKALYDGRLDIQDALAAAE